MDINDIIYQANDINIKNAAERIRAGKLVAFPTETVYGLGGDATDAKAVASIYEAKGRPQFNPLIIHFAEYAELEKAVLVNAAADKIASKYCPGPLTLVLPRKKDSGISLLASAGLDTLAVRMPSHPVARRLIQACGRPVAAPSANASGKLSPTMAAHVAESLAGNIDFILDGGSCDVGVESTVLDLTTDAPVILRHGGVTKEQIEAVLGKVGEAVSDDNSPKSPGMLSSHYAPSLPLRINAEEAAADEALLCFGNSSAVKGGAERLNLSEKGDLAEAAANLFEMLRRLDKPEYIGIAVTRIPPTGLGAAINDRLVRAAGIMTIGE